MSLYSLNINQNRNKKKLRKVRFLITVLYVLFISLSFFLIFKEDKNFVTKSNDLLVYLDPKINVLLFFSLTPIFIDVISLLSLYKSNIQINLSNGKLIREIIFFIAFNIGFAIIFFNNLTYGYITHDAIIIKNVFSESNEYKTTDIKYVNIDLRYKSAVDNYFIDYCIVFKDDKQIELSDFKDCSYEKLMIINKNIEKRGVNINRDTISYETKVKVIDWCKKYPDNLEPFRQLLGLK